MASFIWSGMSNGGYFDGYSLGSGSYGLNVKGYVAEAGTQVILYPWCGGRDNELWTMDSEGHIVSQLNDQLVIGLDSSDPPCAVLCELSDDDPTQQWTMVNGMIQNSSTKAAMTATTGQLSTGWNVVVVDGPPDGETPDNQYWQFAPFFSAPSATVPQWSIIQSALSSDRTNLVLDLQNSTASSATQVVIVEQVPGSGTQKWMIIPDGRVLNYRGEQLVLGLGGPLGNGTNYVNVQTQGMPAIDDELWVPQPDGHYQNSGTGRYLTVSGNQPTPGSYLVTSDLGQGLSGQLFSTLPPNALGSILTAGPQPFPEFHASSDQLAAYSYINQQLVTSGDFLGDLRATYINTDLTANYSDWVTQIRELSCPGTISLDDWTQVSNQLQAELQAVSAVQTLFTNYSTYHSEEFTGQLALVQGLIANAGNTNDGPRIGGVVLAVISGVLYTVLEAIPGGGAAVNAFAVLGNIVQAGINIGVAVQGAGQISADPFQAEVGELWTTLNTQFNNLLAATAAMETAILSDWGKLSMTFTLINSTGPDSLAWPPDLTPQLVTASTPGFTVSIMQMLMPAKYQIYSWIQNNANEFSGVSPLVQRIESNGDGSYTHYWIAAAADWSDYPIDDAMNACFAAGDDGWDFFHSANGWTFAQVYCNYQPDCSDYLSVTVSNQTYNPLNIVLTMVEGEYRGNANPTVYSYMSSSLLGYYYDGLSMQVDIYDPNVSSDSAVASFVAHQHNSVFEGADCWVDSQNQNSGYSLGLPVCNIGSFQDSSGAIQVTVFCNPSSS
ncbi:hypothetical protein V1508DRAFT_428033 [Lipomyces doorenjongii]|uniref:uncharacterized protein n=1 Tax=Lipomyces doorenjongii TaxID=383834 RepID=UPI0034CFB79C